MLFAIIFIGLGVPSTFAGTKTVNTLNGPLASTTSSASADDALTVFCPGAVCTFTVAPASGGSATVEVAPNDDSFNYDIAVTAIGLALGGVW